MLRTTLALAVLLLAGCGGGAESQDSYAISAERYYEAMRVGDFADKSDDQLDTIGKAFCSDLGGMEAELREFAVVAIKDRSPELSEQESFRVGLAMTGRWCPQHASHFLLEE